MNDILKLINSKTVTERSKMCTELLGNQQGGGASGWLTDVINVLRKEKGKDPLRTSHHGYEHQAVKSNVVLLVAALIEGEKA